jgi:hypothetical protein
MPNRSPGPTTNLPYASLGSAVILIIVGASVVMSGNGGENGGAILIGLVVTTIPSLIAAAFAERNAKDIRNGTLTDKAREGAHKALAEAGVTTVTSQAPAAAAALSSLERLLQENRTLLKQNTDATLVNTDAHNHDTEEATP